MVGCLLICYFAFGYLYLRVFGSIALFSTGAGWVTVWFSLFSTLFGFCFVF